MDDKTNKADAQCKEPSASLLQNVHLSHWVSVPKNAGEMSSPYQFPQQYTVER